MTNVWNWSSGFPDLANTSKPNAELAMEKAEDQGNVSQTSSKGTETSSPGGRLGGVEWSVSI